MFKSGIVLRGYKQDNYNYGAYTVIRRLETPLTTGGSVLNQDSIRVRGSRVLARV